MDRNAHVMLWLKNSHVSLSARRAWIEICLKSLLSAIALVALRKESVDRNKRTHRIQTIAQVALRKESVDRNPDDGIALVPHQQSLSARRAWIEICAG